ncbi:MAG: hypothetical protein ACLPQY_33320 [Streptosporangiaceae bacterium]
MSASTHPAAPVARAAALVALACAVTAGCGATAAPRPGRAAPPAPAAPTPLAMSFTGAAGAGRAIVEMGGSAAQEDNFWELFMRPTGTAPWRLATPAGVADNGGLEVAGTGASLVTGFRPSQDLTFSPLASTSDDGATWSPAGPVSPGLADAPDALAAGTGDRLIALTSGGGAQLGTGGGKTWTPLASVAALTAAPAGQACRPTGLTAAAFSGSGGPMLAADCSRPGTVGIFADRGGAWHMTGPALPAPLASEGIDVLRLTASGDGVVALLRAGSGTAATLIAAWSGGNGGPWALSAPLPIGTSQLRATSSGPGGTIGVILAGGRGETLAGPGSGWRALPPLPAWAATLTLGPGSQVDALAVRAGTLSDWRLGPRRSGPGTADAGTTAAGRASWRLAQTVHVTIPYGSSS